jgi:ribosomal protein S14
LRKEEAMDFKERSAAVWRGIHACKKCGSTNVIRRPADKFAPDEFEGTEIRECISCGDRNTVVPRKSAPKKI